MLKIYLRYGLTGLIYLLYCKFRTIIYLPSAKIVRFPIDIRNKKLIKFGTGFVTGRGCRIEVEITRNEDENKYKIVFGSNVQINDYVHITAAEGVMIGANVLIASKVYISDCSHGSYGKFGVHNHPKTVPSERKIFSSPVEIEDNVWIGESVSILMGVTIGEGSIIGANSVVSKSIPPNCIAVGSPAKPIKKFNTKQNTWEAIK